MKKVLLILFLLGSESVLLAQRTSEIFKDALDSVEVAMEARTGVKTDLEIKSVTLRGSALDLHFNRSLTDYPWTKEDIAFFKESLKKYFPSQYKTKKPGNLYANGVKLEEFLKIPHYSPLGGKPFVRKAGEKNFNEGLSGRNIALWHSHGMYFDDNEGVWKFQRAPLFRTCEDMYTQSYVLPFLIPMLENAGAYVLTPRERDTQRKEVVCDNDPQFDGERPQPLRQKGHFETEGKWSPAGTGFADTKEFYLLDENPFSYGTALKAPQVSHGSKESCAIWSTSFEKPGRYSVYVSYKSLPESSEYARYTVRHEGGESVFIVNQRMGGSMWVYLGTFDFDYSGIVTLDNRCPEGCNFVQGRVVSADAVRFGGGMGKYARCSADLDEPAISGLPSYAEGALYSLMWSGFGPEVTHKEEKWDCEYKREYASRGEWVADISGHRHIPVDLSLAFHTDAGKTSCDSTVGTLAIYTYNNDGKTTYPNGRSRLCGRRYALTVQDNVVRDIRALYDSSWARRQIYDRSYSEAKNTEVPGMILELLSHGNFADMKLGADPMFRFSVSRAVYKGILKYLSELYSRPYTVQPLPVGCLSAKISGRDSVLLSWKETPDSLERSAKAKGFILHTRIGEGAFDGGRELSEAAFKDGIWTAKIHMESGELYSFRVTAYNDGGYSFPSETICVGISGGSKKILVVNNFDRVAAPSWFDTPSYAGFDARMDSGICWGDDISYIGEDYEHRRDREWKSDSDPGFGASHTSLAGSVIPGNSFDFISVHAAALRMLGYDVQSASRDAFEGDTSLGEGCFALDLICGKQVSTIRGREGSKLLYSVWPSGLRSSLESFTSNGGNLIVSGAYIATDASESIYPTGPDSLYKAEAASFLANTLGVTGKAFFVKCSGSVPARSSKLSFGSIDFPINYNNVFGEKPYCVDNADALSPKGRHSYGALKYVDGEGFSCVSFDPGNYKCVSFGFPLEALTSKKDIEGLLGSCLEWFKK